MNESVKALDNPQGHDRLIGGHGRFISAHAWEGHLHYGRGAVVVKMSEVKEVRDTPGLYAVSLRYAPAGSQLLKDTGFWPHEGMEDVLRDYDPEKEVVIVIIGLNGMPHSYSWRVPENIAPPRAYKEWREKHPIGIRINPNISLMELLRLNIEFEFKKKAAWDAEYERILSDPAKQAGFINFLIEERKLLKAELDAGGIGIQENGDAYLLDEISSPPKNSLERLGFQLKIPEYLAVTTAVNQMLKACEESRADNENRLREVAKVGIEALEDKRTVIMAAYLSPLMYSEGYLGEDTEEIQKIFLVLTAARLRVRLKKYPRIQAALEAEANTEGKSVEEILLSQLLAGAFIAWSEFEMLPHSSSINDSKILVSKLANFITSAAQPNLERTCLDELLSNTADNTDIARQLECEDEYRAWLQNAGLTASEYEVWELKLKDLTEDEIAKERGSAVGTVKALWSKARRKLKESRKE